MEGAVLIAQRWILARLRHETFFSLTRLNERIAELVTELNDRPMKKLGGISRRQLFERIERAALRPLPAESFVVTEWCRAKVNVDYHVNVDAHLYSVPFTYLHEEVEACLTKTTVEIFHHGKRIASHARGPSKYGFTTDPAHMPEAHRKHFEGGDAIEAWSQSVGPQTCALVRRLLDANPVREQGWRSAKGLQRLAKKHGNARLEAACGQALRFGARSYKPVEQILKLGRESSGLEVERPTPIAHENVRGPGYFH